MINVSNLSYSYQHNRAIAFPDFDVNSNEQLLLLGESGSGKTTLLHLLGGLLRNFSGSIKVANRQLLEMSETELDQFRGQHIGFVFQRNHLISALSVEQNLTLSPYLAGVAIDPARIDSVLDTLGLLEEKYKNVSNLSHGQAQRVAIARAVINKPSIILADEPTSALDDRNCEQVFKLLAETAAKSRSALIIATHDQRLKDKISKTIVLS